MDQMEKSVSCGQWHDFVRPGRRLTMPVLVALLSGICFWPLPALAGSNLQQDYPEHQCGQKPEPPERPEKFRDRAELDSYNELVTAFNAEMEQLVVCLQAYVDDAASDIRAIRDKIEAALESAEP